MLRQTSLRILLQETLRSTQARLYKGKNRYYCKVHSDVLKQSLTRICKDTTSRDLNKLAKFLNPHKDIGKVITGYATRTTIRTQNNTFTNDLY